MNSRIRSRGIAWRTGGPAKTWLVAVALAAAGCSSLTGVRPAKVTLYDERPHTAPTASPSAARRPIPADGRHQVATGDTVYAIARRYGVPIRAIIYANDLQPPYFLQSGRSLAIPQPRVHLVAPGETLYGISRRYDVAMSELVRANRLEEPFRILSGETLILPSSGGAVLAKSEAAPASPSPQPGGIVSRPLPPIGEGVSPSAPVPPSSESLPGRSPSGESAVAAGVPPLEPTPDGSGAATGTQPAQTPAPIASIPQPAARSGTGFLLPVRGRIISHFGPKPGGRHNDGVNIAAPRGTPVRAAENGIVAYSGNELIGFGNLVLLKHDGGYMTAYAHNDALLVSRGDRVERGQTISRVGSTGNVLEPQLHFEIRRGKRAVDPREYLTALARSS